MISIDIDGPSTMLNSICESIVITQGSVYTNSLSKPMNHKPSVSSIPKNVFDSHRSQSSHLRHVIVDQHEEYLCDSSRTPTPSKKKEKIEVIDTWQDRTVIDGSSTIWRSPSLVTNKATKQIQPAKSVEYFTSIGEPHIVQMHIAPSHDVKYRASEQISIPSAFNWNDDNAHTPTKSKVPTRDVALSPIQIAKDLPTSNSSPVRSSQKKVDRSCQYSPPVKHDLASQCHTDCLSTSTQVFTYDIPQFLITHGGTQTAQEVNRINPIFDDSGIQTHTQTVSPTLSAASSDNQPAGQPFAMSGSDFIRNLNEQRTKASGLTVTQFTDGHHYLPMNDHDSTNNSNIRSTTLERSADSGILVDDNHHSQV
jgi:hypothetical protein